MAGNGGAGLRLAEATFARHWPASISANTGPVMNISALSAASSAYSALTLSAMQGRSSRTDGQTSATATAKSGSQVDISDAAREAAKNDGGATTQPERSSGWQRVLDEAKSNPAWGRQCLEQLSGVTTDGPILDISDALNGGPIRLSSTGEIWTNEKQARYSALQSAAMQQRRDIIGAGLAAGAAPDEVLQRVYAFNDTLPQWYKDGMGWS